ncbi:nuclear transport factor 2 family protein [Streptomyces sp. NPDC048045]|uniref:nuclear transport factor 2 family protein n=1 Tax=Streptomyces sp. NPDC048045 TaxID=3154710 RepID=UPI0034475909
MTTATATTAIPETTERAEREGERERESRNLRLVRRAYQAFRARDVGALLATLDPQVEWVHPDGMAEYGLGGTQRGHDGVREFLSRVPAVLGGMRLEPREFVAAGDRVAVFGVREVTSVRGTSATLSFVHSWVLRDGLAVRMEDIFDTVEFHRLIES